MSVYSLTLPTLTLILNIAQLGIPTTIAKLIAKRKYPTFKIIQVSIFILMLIDLIVGIIYIFLVPYIAINYLQNTATTLTLYGMVFLLPIISLTSLFKGYFIAINRVDIVSKCQISEEITRVLFIVIFIDFISANNVSLLSFFAMFSSLIGEIASLIYLIKKLKIKNVKNRLKIENNQNNKIFKNIINVSLLNTSTRIVGSLIYFLEPIIYTYLMVKQNIDSKTITLLYGTINSYVLPMFLLPSFFINALSSYMLPKLSYSIEINNYKDTKKTFLMLITTSFFIGFIFLFIIYLFPEFFSMLIYGKNIGIEYIKRYSFLMIPYFIISPIHITLSSFDKEKNLLVESIICNGIKLVLFFLLIPNYLIDGMLYSIIITLYISILIHVLPLYKSFKRLKEKSQFIIKV